PSPQRGGLRKYFFFPGFTPESGGLLREPGLLQRNQTWLTQPLARRHLLTRRGMPAALTDALHGGWRQMLLFCYPGAPVLPWIRWLARAACPTVLLVPQGVWPGLPALQSDTLRIHEFPYVDQDTFDLILCSSDLNIVRGEDSFVR